MHAPDAYHFFTPDSFPTELLHPGTHDPWLVLLSVSIAIFASWMALLSIDTLRLMRQGPSRAVAFAAASLAFGCGVWAMHFIGMLAFDLSVHTHYDPWLSAASMIPSLLAAGVATAILGRSQTGPKRLAVGGVLVGAGIGAMHYSGMAAMHTPYALHYDPLLFTTSLVVAICLAILALWIRAGLLNSHLFGNPAYRRAVSALVLGLAISGMHYTGMAAARFSGQTAITASNDADQTFFALLITLITVSLTAIVAGANGFLRHREFFRELTGSEARLRALLTTAVDGVITIDADGTIEAFNPAAEKIFQWKADEIIGRNVKTLILQAVLAGQDGWHTCLGSGDGTLIGTSREVTGVRKDGSTLPIRLAVGHTRVNDVEMFVGFVTDISERIAIEAALRSSEQQFRSLIGNIPGIAYRCKVGAGRPMVFISDNVERLTGYQAADFLTDPPRIHFASLIHPADREHVEREVMQAFENQASFLIEYRLLDRRGRVRWMWENGSPVPGDDGVAQLLDGVILDITERKRAEIDSRRFSAIVRSSNDAIISKDLHGIITSWNLGASKVFGYSADEVVGKPMLMLFPPDRVNEEREILVRIAKGETVDPFDTIRRHKNGKLIDISTTISPILDAEQRIVGASTISRDIGERRQMEAALLEAKERAERAAVARAAFLANMSHEIRTPMNAILGFTDVLLLGSLDAQQRRHLDTVRNSARSLLRLLNEILDTAKLDRGAIDLEYKDFDLLYLIDELSSTLGATARSKGLSLHIRYSDQLSGQFHGDELRIRQVLTNLLGNAIKFTESGSVLLHVVPAGEGLLFRVQDSGIGIAAHRLQAIFEPFTQADASMSRRFGGTGLGTTISKKLVELMGGTITVQSTVGVGTTFEVWLPLKPASRAPAVALPSPQTGARALRPLHILVADDVPQNLELLSLLLEGQDHTVVGVEDGAQALARASNERFDVILMDMLMPVMDGLQATRKLREHEALAGRPRTPVIALTASVMDADRLAAQEAGMDGFASKPIELSALSQEIARVLGKLMAPAAGTAASDREAAVLDAKRGLARWADRKDIFERNLRRFAQDRAGLQGALAAMLARKEYSGARSLTHKVRGQAANLGLERLAALLAQLETAIARRDDPALASQLEQLGPQVETALLAIQAYLPPEVIAAAPRAPALDAARIIRLTTELEHFFERGQIDEDKLEELRRSAGGHVNPATLARLNRTIDDFDFAEAIGELQHIRDQLASHRAESARP